MTARSARYLATLTDEDSLRVAHRLIDEALVLQDNDRWEEAERLLDEADRLLEGEES